MEFNEVMTNNIDGCISTLKKIKAGMPKVKDTPRQHLLAAIIQEKSKELKALAWKFNLND